MEQRDTFDTVAALYAQSRPVYPAALFDTLEVHAGLRSGARVLEVGCGTGQATRDLASRAAHVVALDPGANLIAEAARYADAPNITYVVSRFEDYAPDLAGFDLVVSAQAWHWVYPEIGHAKAAEALRPGGALAIFGHVPFAPDGDIGEAFRTIYERFIPGAWGQPPSQAAYLKTGPFADMIAASGRFAPAEHFFYPWTWVQDGKALGEYLRTDSSYRALPDDTRTALFDALSDAVTASGRPLQSRWETHLYIAHRL